MPRQVPYLLRRGDTFFFRIVVPADLRPYLGWREITKTLRTPLQAQAAPMALEYAAVAKRAFNAIRVGMAEQDDGKLMQLVLEKRQQLRLTELQEQHEEELFEQRQRHLQELRQVRLEAENEAMRRVLAGFSPASSPTSVPVEKPSEAPVGGSKLTFKAVVDKFMSDYNQRVNPAMFKKHQTVLPLLLSVVGDKPINQIKQADINRFFDLIQRLPPRWSDQCRKEKLTVFELSELEHAETIGPKTFRDTYKASVRPFLIAAITDWMDEGFPPNLTTDGAKYKGDRK